jgi:NADH-quinone oxidoreductase subunit H
MLLLLYILMWFFLVYFLLSVTAILLIIICIALFTLLERKVLAAIQRRSGPNTVGFWGFLQPFADALKSITKEINIPFGCDYYYFIFSPILTLVLSLMPWSVIPFSSFYVFANVNYGVLFILLVSSLNVYGIILAGWSSNSKYALLGAMRSAAQMISYEIPLSLTIIPVIMVSESMNLSQIVLAQKSIWFVFPFLPCAIIFIICALAETNRTPFDLPEAEAEIVAGYNVEYSSIFFAMFFLAEYGNIMSICSFGVCLFWGGWLLPDFLVPAFQSDLNLEVFETFVFSFKILFFMFFFIFVRAVLPRYRYDQLMDINWKVFLPFFIVFCYV